MIFITELSARRKSLFLSAVDDSEEAVLVCPVSRDSLKSRHLDFVKKMPPSRGAVAEPATGLSVSEGSGRG